MAKFGYLYLQNGVWDNNQIVPKKWVKESTQQHSVLRFGQQGFPYGYQWWVIERNGHPGFAAVGIGGQYITVIPDLDIVMVATSNDAGAGGRQPEHYKKLLGPYIIPSVVK
jgi:CubicO group peptidase (beta-lactamase class C family)